MRILLLLVLVACGGAPSATPDAPSTSSSSSATRSDIDVSALHAAMDAGTVDLLVDVRTPAEYASGHVPGAVNIPLDELPSRYDELRAHDVTVVCQSGGRSSTAAGLLVGQGIDAVNVEGGTSAWRAAGYPVE